MSKTTVIRMIVAPLEKVFRTVSDISQFSEAVPHIINVEFISDIRTGVGARFRETRLMNGKEASTELEVAEYEENDKVRMISDAGGTIWDTLFSVKPVDGKTELTVVMDAKAYKFMAKIVNPLIRGMVEKAIGKDIDAIKDWCEKSANTDN